MRRGLAVIPADGVVLVEGGPRRHMLKGRDVPSLVPKLLPLLDGHHDRAAICAELTLERGQLDQVLALLDDCGLLELRPAATGAAKQMPENVLAYLSRIAGTTGDHCTGGELAAVLAGASVLLVAPGTLGEQIAADLAETGVGSVAVAANGGAVSAGAVRAVASASRGVIAVFDERSSGRERDDLADVTSRCRESGLPVLRFAYGPRGLEIGPIFHDGFTACAICFRRGYQATAGPAQDLDGTGNREQPTDPSPHNLVLAGLVTGELLALLSRMTVPALPRRLTRISLPGFVTERYDLTPEPDCANCDGWQTSGDTAHLPEIYEWQMRSPTMEVAEWQAAPGPDHLRRFAALQAQRTDVPHAPRLRLPDQQLCPAPLGPGHPATGASHRGIADTVVAGILVRVAGLRPGADAASPKRWAPSGGNLASVEVFLLTDGSLIDLPGTIFKYDDIGHQVVGVRAEPVSLSQALAGTDLEPATLDLALVLVGAVGRVGEKYGDFALRLAHLDAGCAAAQLSAVAAGYGRCVSFASTWPAELADLLDLNPGAEVITAVAGFRRLQKGDVACR